MDDQLVGRLWRLLDRQEIVDCLHRYTRGADRLDEELLVSAFHEDAIDHHGIVTGTARDFVAYWWPQQGTRVTSQHYLGNPTIEIDGDIASSETYFLSVNRQRGETEVKLVGGRYVDRLERRDGEWRIAERVVLGEWTMTGDGPALGENKSRRDRSDPSYGAVPAST
jgi:hypothetical protein